MLLAVIFPKGQILYSFFFSLKPNMWNDAMSTVPKKKCEEGKSRWEGANVQRLREKYANTPQNFCCLELVQPASLHNHTNLHRVYVMRSLSVSLSVSRFVCVCVYPSILLSIHPSVHESAQTWRFSPKVSCNYTETQRCCYWLSMATLTSSCGG